jgi:hypothetical protein
MQLFLLLLLKLLLETQEIIEDVATKNKFLNKHKQMEWRSLNTYSTQNMILWRV